MADYLLSLSGFQGIRPRRTTVSKYDGERAAISAAIFELFEHAEWAESTRHTHSMLASYNRIWFKVTISDPE